MNIQVYCNRCGLGRLRLEYRIVNRNTRYVFRDFFCFDCGSPSQLRDYFDNDDYKYEYYVMYKKNNDISNSYEQFTNKAIKYIKEQIVETVLKDVNGNQLRVWEGYVDQEVYQFLRW